MDLLLISFLCLIGCLGTNQQLSSLSATNLCNNAILQSMDLMVNYSGALVPSNTTLLPVLSRNASFWQIDVREKLIIDLHYLNGTWDQYWITGVAINQLPPNGSGLEGECHTQVDANDTEEFELRRQLGGISNQLTSPYATDGLYKFSSVARSRDVSVKVSVTPVLADKVEIIKTYNGSIGVYCVRIELFGCKRESNNLTYPTILSYAMPVPDATATFLTTNSTNTNSTNSTNSTPYTFSDTLYTGICSSILCTGGNGLLTDGNYGSPRYEDHVGFRNCSPCNITFHFGIVVAIEKIILYGIHHPNAPVSSTQPPLSVSIVNDVSNSLYFTHSEANYALTLLLTVQPVTMVTLRLIAMQNVSILLNEIEFFSNASVLLNTQIQSMTADPVSSSQTPLTSTSPTVTTNETTNSTSTMSTQAPPPTNPPPPPPPPTTQTSTPTTQSSTPPPPTTQPSTPTTNPPPPPTTQPSTPTNPPPPPPPPTTQPSIPTNLPPPSTTQPPRDNRPPPNPNTPPPNSNTPPGANQMTTTLPPPPRPPAPPSLLEQILDFSSPATLFSVVICIICLVTTCAATGLVAACWFFLIKYKLRYKESKKENQKLKVSNEIYGVNLRRRDYANYGYGANNVQPPNLLLPNAHQQNLQISPNVYSEDTRIYEAIPGASRPAMSATSSIYEIEDINDLYEDSIGHWDQNGQNSGISSAEVHSNPHMVHDGSSNLLTVREENYIPMASTHF